VLYANRAFFVFYLILWFILAANSQAWALEPTDDIDTNRPSFMDSPLVVPKGSLQLENGTLYEHFQHGRTSFDIPETEVRLGLTKRTEFQMSVPNWVLQHTVGSSTVGLSNTFPSMAVFETTPGGTRQGVSDLNEAGLKHQFPTLFKDGIVSLIAGVNIPTGRSFISGGGVQPVIRVPWEKGLAKSWAIEGMQSILVVNDGRDVQWQNFCMLNKTFGRRTFIFIEYAGFYTHQAAPSNIIHFGLVRKLNRHNQIDTHFGFGLNQAAPAAFVGAGYSFRFDGLLW